MTSLAPQLFDSIQSGADVRSMVVRQEAERLHLDFKQQPQARDLAKLVSKGLSGFANSDGGVLVFGVAEDESKKLVDSPLEDAPQFEADINKLFSRGVAFPVENVVTRVLLNGAGPEGYVIVLVPKSDLAPHRSEITKQYYRRVGESFVPMEHYEIADIFGRRHRPDLQLVVTLECGARANTHQSVDAVLSLRNRGRALARFPAITFTKTEGTGGFALSDFGLDGNGHTGLPVDLSVNSSTYRGGADHVVHTGSTRGVTRMRASYDQAPAEGPGVQLAIEATIQAEYLQARHVRIEFTDTDLANLLNHGKACEKTAP